MRCLLLLSVLLLTGACKKEPAPTPTPAALEDRWVWQRATDTYYDAAGKVSATRAQTGAPGDFLLVITAQTWQHLRGDGGGLTLPAGYIRQADTVIVDKFTRLTIKELTPHTLVLYHLGEYTLPTAGSAGGRTDTEVSYSR